MNELLSAQFDGHPQVEFVDLMQYGYWGEGHTANLHNPFPDYATAERTFVDFTRQQLEAWKRTPLAVNTEPDISLVGNRRVIEMCTGAGAWLRSDSILVEEPIQIDMLANRPPWLAVIMEDGYDRQYKLAMQPRLERAMRHVLNVGGTTGRCGPRPPTSMRFTRPSRGVSRACAAAWVTACARAGSGNVNAAAPMSW